MAPERPQGWRARVKHVWGQYTGLWEPWSLAVLFYFEILFRELRNGNTHILRRLSRVGDEAFAKWWLTLSHHFVRYEDTTVVPSLVASAYGVVLDLGAGTGNQLARLDATKLQHVYGLEPNAAFAPALRAKIQDTGLEGTYTPIVAGVEDAELELARQGVAPGTVDCVLSIQILCSVRDPAAVVRQLHHLLKPGGELIFWEHEANRWSATTRLVQWLWTFVWSPVIGGCRLNRRTRDILLSAADWEVVELDGEEDPGSVLPRVWGRLRKGEPRCRHG